MHTRERRLEHTRERRGEREVIMCAKYVSGERGVRGRERRRVKEARHLRFGLQVSRLDDSHAVLRDTISGPRRRRPLLCARRRRPTACAPAASMPRGVPALDGVLGGFLGAQHVEDL